MAAAKMLQYRFTNMIFLQAYTTPCRNICTDNSVKIQRQFGTSEKPSMQAAYQCLNAFKVNVELTSTEMVKSGA